MFAKFYCEIVLCKLLENEKQTSFWYLAMYGLY